MQFSKIARVFDEISQSSSRLVITQLLAELFDKVSSQDAGLLSYLLLGTLRPAYRGNQFNLAEKSATKVIAELLGLDPARVTQLARQKGDLADVIAEFSWNPTHTLSLEQVYESLVELEKISGVGAQEARAQWLLDLLRAVDPLSAGYIIRIVLGKLRLGFSEMTIIDALSWMLVGNKSARVIIEDAYNRCADIGLIAEMAKSKGLKGLEKVSMVIGIPIRPAAAERMDSPEEIVEKLKDCVAQPKIDGFRLQIHIDKQTSEGKVWFFSRNLHDMTTLFPDLVEPFLNLEVENLIIEGEAIAYDEEADEFVLFQETVKRKRKHDIENVAADLPLRLFLFDILYLNGQELLALPHHARRYLLEEVFAGHKEKRVQVIEEFPISTAQQLEDYFFSAIAEGLEGLMVKRTDAIYQPGKRNFNWIKLKRHEKNMLDDTIDAVILGYYKGRGKRAHFGIGAFLAGVYNPKEDRFESITRVGTGLKDDDLREMKKQCDAIKVNEQPKNVVCAKELAPDVWVTPAIVCVLLADQITLSPMHAAGKNKDGQGYALRFPRFMGYRPDKSADEATTVEEIKRLYSLQNKA